MDIQFNNLNSNQTNSKNLFSNNDSQLFTNNQPGFLFGPPNLGNLAQPGNAFNLFSQGNSQQNDTKGVSIFNLPSNTNKSEIEGEKVINSKKNENNTKNNNFGPLFGSNPFNSGNTKTDNNFYSKGFNNNFDETSDHKGYLFGNKGKNEDNSDKKFTSLFNDGKTTNFLFSENEKKESFNKNNEDKKEKNEGNKTQNFFLGLNNTNSVTDKNEITGKLFKNDNEKESKMNSNKEKNENLKETNYSFNPFAISNADKNSQSNKEENNLFKMTSENNRFDKKEDNSNIYYNNEYSKNEIKTVNIVEMDNNNDVSNSKYINKFIQNKNEEENSNENEEMEIDEDIKKDSSSINSDIINNLWVPDNDEIIEDEIDANKRIDYKILEENSKNKKNNINALNLLILPELSEYYFEKSKLIYDYSDSGSTPKEKFSIEISGKIIEILNKLIKNENLKNENYDEWINIVKIFIYFDAFILHRTDTIFLMKLRDNLFYKYNNISETIINFEKNNSKIIYNKENSNINSLITILKKIFFSLTMLDVDKAYQQIGLIMQIYESSLRTKIFGNHTMKFKDLFMNMEKIIKIYNTAINIKDSLNPKQMVSSFNMLPVFNETLELLQEMKNEKEVMEQNLKKIFMECQKIIGLLTGNMEVIINEYNKNNIDLIILANIFYRFYKIDFIKGIVDCLKNKNNELNIEENLVNKIIMKIIENCDQNQIEIVQELKGVYPFLLRYHMIEILNYNAFLFQVENQEKYLKKEAYALFENFRDLKVPFKYYLNYFSSYPNFEIFTVNNINDIDNLDDEPSEDLRDIGYIKGLDYALIYTNSKFNDEENVEEIKNEIDEIKNEIGNKVPEIYSNDILYKINKLCLIKYNEKNIYKYGVLSYIENYNLENKDLEKLKIRQQRNQLCANNELNFDYSKQFDKVIINLFLNTNYIFNKSSFRDKYENQKLQIDQDFKDIQELLDLILIKKEQISVDNNVQFIINYAQFLLNVMKYYLNIIEKNDKYNIDIVLSCKQFFTECFPLPKCPVFLWYHILMTIKNVIDENIEEFSNDTFMDENNDLYEDLSIWDKKLIYEIIKVEKIKGNNIKFEIANTMYENAISFVNELIQGFYFNQNLYSHSQMANY